jgi:uncharacterized protein
LVLGATDRRIRAVVSQVPTISGYQQGLRRVAPDAFDTLERQFDEDERAQFRGDPPRRQQIVNDDPNIPAAYRAKDAIAFYLQPLPQRIWKNDVTVRSGRLSRMYDPGNWVARVSPTPLLMIVALADRITQTDLQLRAFEQALEPKKLVTIEGGHFDPYVGQFDRAKHRRRFLVWPASEGGYSHRACYGGRLKTPLMPRPRAVGHYAHVRFGKQHGHLA